MASEHSIHSSYREMLLEHLFAGAVMSHMWRNGLKRVEMLKPQVDNSGYDIVLESDGVVRHIQLKASHRKSSTARVNINLQLREKPSGCVIWMLFDQETLEFGPFLWFGAEPGEPLPALEPYRVGTATRHNAAGVRPQRPNIRVLPRSAFTRIDSLEELLVRLFGTGVISDSGDDVHPNEAKPSV